MLAEAEIITWLNRVRDELRTDGLTALDPALAEKLVWAFEGGLRRLCAMPLSDPFWYPSNLVPTTFKVGELAARQLAADADLTQRWTLWYFDISRAGSHSFDLRPFLADDPRNARWLLRSIHWIHRHGMPIDLHRLATELVEARRDRRFREFLDHALRGQDPFERRAARMAIYLSRRTTISVETFET